MTQQQWENHLAEKIFVTSKNDSQQPDDTSMQTLMNCDIDNIKTAIAEARERFPEHVTIEADALELLLNSYLKNETHSRDA
jgi:hypothetical protein